MKLSQATGCLLAIVLISTNLLTPFRRPGGNLCVLKTVMQQSDAQCRDGDSWLLACQRPSPQAIQTLTAHLSQQPQHRVVRLRLGEQLWAVGQREEAFAVWQVAPEIGFFFAQQSAQFAAVDEIEAAQQSAEIAHTIHPAPAYAMHPMYQSLCSGWQTRSQPARALAWCERDAQVVRDGWTALALADAQFGLGEYEAALSSLGMVLAGGSAELQAIAHQKRGDIFLAQGNYSQAINAYQAALQQGPNNQWLHFGLAQSYLMAGKITPACQHLTTARQLDYQLSEAHQQQFRSCTP